MHTLKKYWPALLLSALGVYFLFWGIAQGAADSVFQKAAKICLECIGIG